METERKANHDVLFNDCRTADNISIGHVSISAIMTYGY